MNIIYKFLLLSSKHNDSLSKTSKNNSDKCSEKKVCKKNIVITYKLGFSDIGIT